MSKHGVVFSIRSWSANKRSAICRNANNIHLELRLRDSRRVPFIWRSGSRSIPHHLRVFPFIYELHEREYWFSSLFNPNQWSKHSKDSVDSRVILYRGEIDWFSWKIRENRGWIRLERLGEERITRYTTCKILILMNEVTSFFYKISKDFLFGI